jgi:hypothetical protein
MLSAPREEFAKFWEFGNARFPHWVGFRAERHAPLPELLRTYRQGEISMRKCLRDWKRNDDITIGY